MGGTEIFSKVDEGQIATEWGCHNQHLQAIMEAISLAEEIANPVEPAMMATAPTATTVRLPTIQLPFFEGNPIEFPMFMDAFKVVDENANLSGATKLTYLVGQLKGCALSSIDAFSQTDANYLEALDVLKSRYGNTNIIINTLIDNIIGQKPPPQEFIYFERFVAGIESNCRQLKSLDPILFTKTVTC